MTDKIKTIRIPGPMLREVKEELQKGRKIAAIKKVRTNARCGSVGLKEAKLAVERLEHEMGLKSHPHSATSAHKIGADTFIRSITLDLGGGELSVDLEQMEMRALMGLDSMGIDEVARVLDLVKILKAFGDGANISVDRALSEDSEEEAPE